MTETEAFGSTQAPADRAAARTARRVLEQWWLVGICAVVAGVVAFSVSASRTKEYEASSTIEVGTIDLMSIFLSQDVQIGDIDPERETASAVELFNLPNVRDRAVKGLAAVGITATSREINAAVKAVVKPDTSVIKVTARNRDPRTAQAMSNAMTAAFIQQRQATAKKKLESAKRQVTEQYNALSEKDKQSQTGIILQNRLRQVGVVGALSDGNVTIVQAARLPEDPVSPRPKRDAILGLLAGLLIGGAVALLRARLDDRVRDSDELTELWDLPIVGLIPQTGTLKDSGRGLPEPAALEALSLARTNLRYLNVGGRVKTVIVTSALESEGKSTVTWNLAIAASMAASRVLVVEADLRRPRLSSRLGLGGSGLSEVLAGMATTEETISTIEVKAADGEVATTVDVLPAGLAPPSPVALLEGPVTKPLLDDLRERYDVVLIDTPPATVVADAVAIVDEVDGVVIVSRLGTVRRGALKRLRQTLTSVEAPVLGQIINSDSGVKSYGYYSSYVGKRRSRRDGANSALKS